MDFNAVWESFMDVLANKYAQFQGRARRREYWYFMLVYMLIYGGLFLLSIRMRPIAILAGLFSLGMLIPSIALAARRLHDIGRSGWWQLIGMIPIIGSVILLIFLCKEGTSGQNFYGPDPKGGASVPPSENLLA